MYLNIFGQVSIVSSCCWLLHLKLPLLPCLLIQSIVDNPKKTVVDGFVGCVLTEFQSFLGVVREENTAHVLPTCSQQKGVLEIWHLRL